MEKVENRLPQEKYVHWNVYHQEIGNRCDSVGGILKVYNCLLKSEVLNLMEIPEFMYKMRDKETAQRSVISIRKK